MDQQKNAPMSKTHGDGEDGDNVFFENRFSQPSEEAVVHVLSTAKTETSIPSTYSRFLFDPRDIRYHSGSGHRRNPSYDSRDSTKSVSDCSYVSGSPCESPGLHELSLQSLSSSSSTPFSSTSAMAINQNIVTDINPFHSEKDFVDYLLTLPPTSSKGEHSGPISQPIVAPPAIKSVPPTQTHQGPPQIGLDHLENLCKLMEQLGELREHNSKLQKRVQYLEEMRNLNELRQNLKEVLEEAIATSPHIVTDNRNLFAFDLSNDDGSRLMTKSPQLDAKRSTSNAVKLRKSSSKRRTKQQKGRSQSMGDDDITYDHQKFRQSFQNNTGNKAKVSKWAKVKEALKWERVQVDPRSSNPNNPFYVDNNDGGHQCQTMISKASVTLKPIATSNRGDSAARFDNEDQTKQKPVAGAAVKYLQKTDTMREIIVPGQMADNQDATDNMNSAMCPSSSKEMFYETDSTDDEELLDLTDPRNKRRSLGNNVVLGDTSPVDPTRTQSRKIKISKETTLIDEDQVKMRKGRSLERNVDPGKVLLRSTQSEKENKKLSKGAWGKVKTILQTRKDSLKRKHRKSACLDAATDADKCISAEGELYTAADDVWLPNNEESHVTTVRTESDIDTAQAKSKNSSTSSNYGLEEVVELVHPDKTKSSTKATKPPQLTIAILPEEPKPKTPTSENADSSPNYQLQTSKWTKVKKVFHNTRDDEGLTGNQQRPQSVPASPSNVTTFRYEDLDFLEEYFRETKETGDCSSQNESEDNLGLSDPQRRRNRLSVAEREAPLPITMSSDVRRHLEDMQRNVTEDFTKKMQEWERLKSSYSATKPSNVGQGFQTQQQPQQSSPRLDRKCSSSFSGQKFKKAGKSDTKWEQQGKISKDKPVVEREHLKGEKQREKELQWLEKQLQKIEREKQRLAKERQKYLEREARLEKMRESMMKPTTDTEKKEILIKTSAGEFRFQGISENFTRKLHEWETMRGIGPEVSTLTLLGNQNQPASTATQSDSSIAVNNVNNVSKQVGYDYNSLAPPPVGFGGHFGRLTERNRSHSESSLANMANVQTSTTSLVMRPDDILNMDFINDNEMYMDTDSSSVNALTYSRANSEPEINFNAMLIEGGPCAMEVEQMHFEESIPCLEIPAFPVEEPVYSYAPDEVTQLIDSSNSSSDVERDIQIVEGKENHEDQTFPSQEHEKCPSSPKTMPRQNAIDKDSPNYDGQLKTTPTKVKLTTVGPVCVGMSEEENAFFKDKWERQDTALERPTMEDDKSKPSTPRETHSKKKNGVNKVKEISAELIQQAKTLEQTLLEKNVTIRQLQWELLQREMSNKRFQSELEKVTGHVGLLAEGPSSSAASKGKSNHQRSWSAVETVHAKRMEEMENKRATANHSPLELIKITEKSEISASPIGLARKVDELKSELKYLWGSQESNTNSICSELATDKDPWTINRNGSVKEKSSPSVDQPKECEMYKDEDVENKRDNNNSNMFQMETRNNVEAVAIRRVSDTVIPPYIQSNINSRISKLPMSPQMNRSKSLSQNSTPTTSRKIVQNITPMSPETTARSSSHSRIPAKKVSPTSPYLQRQMCVEENIRSSSSNMQGTSASSSSMPIKLNRQRKLASYKESCPFVLRRQNAEDYASTSDTDSEGSNGVTFTVKLEAKKPPSTDSPKQQRATCTNALVESPSLSRMKHPVTSVSNVPWRKNSKDEEIVDNNTSDCVATDEQLSAPSTPIVRSRSTRKLKPPTANKTTTQSGPEASSTATVTQLPISPLAMRRGVGNDNTSPNVRLMIEKFNRRVNEVNNPALSSPNMSTNRSQFEGCCVPMLGVKKSTSFNDTANYAAENAKSAGYGSSKSSVNQVKECSVVKSASTSVIEKGSRHYCSKPPLSPEVSTRKIINSPQQPVGIASRIPRCLTAICEQESIDKDTNKVDQIMVDVYKENNAVNQQKFDSNSNGERIKMQQTETGNSKIGTRALEIKRAKEMFLTKSPSTTPTSPNQPQAPVSSGWRAFYQRSTSASSHNSVETLESTETSKFQKLSSNITAETSSTKPKSILKHNRGDPVEAEQMPARRAEPPVNLDRWSDDQQLLDDDDNDDEREMVGGGLIKCASAGAVDFAVNYGLVSTSEPRMSTQSSTDSSDKHQKSTCGLFSFRFRRPKLSKQKKSSNPGVVEPLPAVKALCRQSLLVDIDPNTHDHPSRSTSALQQQYVSTSTAPPNTSSISCPSSPEARPKQNVSKTSTGLWQNKPRTIFKSK